MGRQVTVADDEILSVFDDKGDVLTVSEIATEISLGNRSTLKRLQKLVDRDTLENKKVGQTWVWWRSEHNLSAISSGSDYRVLSTLRLPVQDDDPRIDVIRECVNYVRTNGDATPEEIRELVNDSEENIQDETIEMALQQLHNDVVMWDEKLQCWQNNE